MASKKTQNADVNPADETVTEVETPVEESTEETVEEVNEPESTETEAEEADETVVEEDEPDIESDEEESLNGIRSTFTNAKLTPAERQQQIYAAMNQMVVVRN